MNARRPRLALLGDPSCPAANHAVGTRSCSSESGFSLVEIVVVLVILAIIAGFALSVLMSPAKAAKQREALTAVHAYADAVRIFEKDHGGRPPSWTTSATNPVLDWPADRKKGPVRDDGTTYMEGGIPESIGKGTVTWDSGSSTLRWRLQYEELRAGTVEASWRLTLHPPTQSNHKSCEITGTPSDDRDDIRTCP